MMGNKNYSIKGKRIIIRIWRDLVQEAKNRLNL